MHQMPLLLCQTATTIRIFVLLLDSVKQLA